MPRTPTVIDVTEFLESTGAMTALKTATALLSGFRRRPHLIITVVLLIYAGGCGRSQEQVTVGSPVTVSSGAAADSGANAPELSASPVATELIADAPDKKDTDEQKWASLFDGESLGNWRSTQFGGEAEVSVDDGMILLPIGEDMTGITWRGEPPARMNYEMELEAQRVDGHDFFCGLTFPVGKDFCSLICGGWGGGVTGLSSLDGNDASRNETSQWINYEKGRWYRIRVRVTEHKIQAWLDDNQIVDTDTTDRKIGIRGEVEPSKPLGIATWRTTGAVRGMRIRKLGD